MVVDPTPGQTPPSMKNAAGLSGDFEYAGIWTGQSNSRPWGYAADGLSVALELILAPTGVVVTNIVIPDVPRRSVGMVEWLAVGTTLKGAEWNTSTWLRFGASVFDQSVVSAKGYAKVIDNTTSTIRVQWISLPDNDQTIIAGYLVRENGKYYSYEHARVLTPYVPLQDITSPSPGAPAIWFAPTHSPYPTPDAALSAEGRRLTLPAPHTLPAAVTKFDDLAVFLPITRREGSVGYGISEIADATFIGTGDPVGHPILDITTGVFTFHGAIAAGSELAGGYLIVDWELAGVSQRSWARITSNDTTSFTPDPTSWLGDGEPDDPVTDSVTFDTGQDEVIWSTHGLVEGTRVAFFGTTPPSGIVLGRIYRVRNVNGADRFQVSESMGTPIVDIGAGDVGISGVVAWIYTAWVPHWKDNPYMWLPGPEFGYPNEDQQPRGSYVHFRARGQLLFVHQSVTETGGVLQTFPFDGVVDARFGAMLVFAWRVGTAIGKRINMVCLGANGAPLMAGNIQNFSAAQGIIGWWNYERFGFGLPMEDSDSQMSQRLKRLITFIAPQALLAEGNAKEFRYLSVCHVQGETDSVIEAGRELYIATITDYKEWLRDLITGLGVSPFEGDARMPFAQPLLTRDPWETSGQGEFQSFGIDANGEANDAMRQVHTAAEFSGYTLTEDIPKLKYADGFIDNAHFSGQGMVWQGARLAALILELLEHALSYGSSALNSTNARLLRIANLALLYVGEGSVQITSLAENTAGAKLVAMLLPEATTQLLSMRQWSWATRIEPATQVHHDNPNWLYAYVVPARAMTPIAIMQPVRAAATTVANRSTIPPSDAVVGAAKPEPFEIGRSSSGHRLLFTNVPEIPGDVTVSPIVDGLLHPERLPTRPTLRYVDKVIDPDRYSESFATALTWLLTSMLAPAMVKGQEGEVVATRALQKASGYIDVEAAHETVTQQPLIDHREIHQPTWIGSR